MGAGASIDDKKLSKEEIIEKLLPHFVADEKGCEEVYRQLIEKAKSQKSPTGGEAVSKEVESSEEQKKEPANIDHNASSFTTEIVSVLNRVRSDPKSFVSIVQEHLNSFTDDLCYKDREGRENMVIRTREGKAAVQDCIDYLNKISPVPLVKGSPLLENAALDHVKDLCADHANGMSHTGSDGSTTRQRVERYARWHGTLAENIDCGNKLATHVILALLIDDGIPSRGHRLNCMNPELLEAGAALAQHPKYNSCCVIDFASSVTDWNLLQRENIMVTATSGETDISKQPEEFQKVLRTIPMESIGDEVKEMLKDPKNKVSIDFKAKEQAAVLICTHDTGSKEMTVSWGKKT